MAQPNPITLVPVHDDTRDINSVATTITASFSNDPLIKWLRPNAAPWSTSHLNTMRWQCRRVQRAIYDGEVYSGNLSSDYVQTRSQDLLLDAKSQDQNFAAECVNAGAAVVLVPPKRPWTLSRVILGAKLSLLDKLSPVVEGATNMQRLEQLMKVHDDGLLYIKRHNKLHKIWYLEIVALHPSLQNRGLGRRVMERVIEHAGNEAIALECTAEGNVKFYEKLGFVTSKVADLSDENGSVRLWFMVRLPSPHTQAN